MRVLGALFVIAGVLLLIYGGVTLFLERDVFDLGPMTIAITENMEVPLPPVLGLVLLIVGLLMMMSAPAYYAPPPSEHHHHHHH